jgi:hypothetical protein
MGKLNALPRSHPLRLVESRSFFGYSQSRYLASVEPNLVQETISRANRGQGDGTLGATVVFQLWLSFFDIVIVGGGPALVPGKRAYTGDGPALPCGRLL